MDNIVNKIYQSITENRDVDPKLKDWIEKKSDAYPTCCVYKNCSIDFRVWGITNIAEKYCMEFQLGVFNRVAGMAFCAMDQYIDLSSLAVTFQHKHQY